MSKIAKLTALALIFLTLIISNCGKKSTKSEPPDTIISDKVVILEEEPDVSLDIIKDSTYTFKFTGAPPEVSKDDILIGTENGGYLRRVMSVTIEDSSMIIETDYAVLTDAIITGTLDTTIQLKIEELHKQSGQGLGLIYAAKGVSVAEGIINLSGVELFSGKVGGADVEVSITEGSVSFDPSFDLGFKIENSRIKEFHAIARGYLAFDCDLGITASDKFTYAREVNIATFQHVAVQFVGIVPIVEVITLSFDAGFESEVSYAGVTEFGFESGIDVGFGARYTGGLWSSVWDKETNLLAHPVVWPAEAEAQIRGYIEPSISVELYAVAGPYLEVEPYLGFAGEITTYPSWYWYWELFGGICGDIGFKVSILSYNLADFSTELLRWEMIIATESNTAPTANITSPTDGSSFQEGANITFTGTGTDPEGGVLTGSSLVWTSDQDGQIGTGTSFSRNDLSVNTHKITLIATDSNGLSGSDSISITVSPFVGDTTPPAAITDLAATNPTSTSITLTWTAPGDDGNSGTASQYDIRYSTSNITESNWGSATQCTGEPTPKTAGSSESFVVTGLNSNTKYYFAIKTADEVLNWSGLSNVAIDSTKSPSGTVEFVGSYDTPHHAVDVFVSGDYAYVADVWSGLQIINISNPSNPTLAGSYDTPYQAVRVFVSGNYAYLGDGDSGLLIINISNHSNPTLVGSYDTPSYARDVFVSGNYAYVADSDSGLYIINISNPSNPTLAGSYDTPGFAKSVFVSGNYAYVADRDSGLHIINISNPSNPTLAGSYDTPGYAWGVFVSGNYAYIADGSSGLHIINISVSSNPTLAASYDTPEHAWNVFVSGNYAYVADGSSDLLIIINISNPSNPTLAGTYNNPDWARGVFVSGNYIYVAAFRKGLQILRFVP